VANALFVCLHNAGRSQMSQALFERAAGGRHGARSAGTAPGERVHPRSPRRGGSWRFDAVRATRDEIAARVEELVAELDQASAAPE
jgi:hypothetical protein